MAHALPQTPTETQATEEAGAGAERQHRAAILEHIAWLVAQARGRQADPYRYVLLLRFALANLVGFSLLGAAYLQGLVTLVLDSDQTGLSAAIFVVFLGGLGICARKVAQTSRELNRVRDFSPLSPSRAGTYLSQVRGRVAESRSIYAGLERLKLSNQIAVVRHIAGSLVLLGLIGTVIGFIIALSGVHPQRVSDIDTVAPMVSKLIEGMSVALYTTLVGAILNLWLMVNYHILATGTVKLITAIVEFGESHART